MPTDQQPEEAAGKVPAAAASAVGSYTQTQMYGRGFRQRADSTQQARERRPTQQAGQGTPSAVAHDPAREPEVSDTARQSSAGETPPAGGDPESLVVLSAADAVAEEGVSHAVAIACSAQDAAAARARLAQGQRVEPVSVAPPAPGLAPGL
jgi:hypothetical protein